MGLLEFNKLPINTLVGADWKTFNAITKGREIRRFCRARGPARPRPQRDHPV